MSSDTFDLGRRPFVQTQLDITRYARNSATVQEQLHRRMFELFVVYHRMHRLEPDTAYTYMVYKSPPEGWEVTVWLMRFTSAEVLLGLNEHRLYPGTPIPANWLEEWVQLCKQAAAPGSAETP